MPPSYKGTGRNATTGQAEVFVSGGCPPGNAVLAILRRDILVDHAADHLDYRPPCPRLGGGMSGHVERGELLRGLLRAALQRVWRHHTVEEAGGDGFGGAE